MWTGLLCRSEFDEVNKRLNVKWDTASAWKDALAVQALEELDRRVREKLARADQGLEQLADEADSVDPHHPEISFKTFVSVYNQASRNGNHVTANRHGPFVTAFITRSSIPL